MWQKELNDLYYQMIFKRKSFHLYRNTGKISDEELQDIKDKYKTISPLISNIRTEIEIIPACETNFNSDGEYCIVFYSEDKPNYLQNIGYIGQQLDMYMTSKNIGTLWFGIGRIDKRELKDLKFVIMMVIAKMPEEKFREDMKKAKRKPLSETWSGEKYINIGEIARYAPSACNSQPWSVEENDNKLSVYRNREPGAKGIMPAEWVPYYNRIDMGIYLMYLETCLSNEGIDFERKLFDDPGGETAKILVAEYILK